MNSKETVVRLEANLVSRWPTVFTPCSVSVLPGLDTALKRGRKTYDTARGLAWGKSLA